MTVWKDSLLVGIPQIDDQHKKLIAAIDKLMDACTRGQGRATIEETLIFVVSYTKEHFADEERLQARVAYPGMEAHKKLHAQFVSNISQFVTELRQDGPSVALTGKINSALVNWLVRHIGTEDKKIGEFIRSKNG